MTEKVIWIYSVQFLIRKDVSAGDVEKLVKGLGESVEIMSLNKQKGTDTKAEPDGKVAN